MVHPLLAQYRTNHRRCYPSLCLCLCHHLLELTWSYSGYSFMLVLIRFYPQNLCFSQNVSCSNHLIFIYLLSSLHPWAKDRRGACGEGSEHFMSLPGLHSLFHDCVTPMKLLHLKQQAHLRVLGYFESQYLCLPVQILLQDPQGDL